MMLVEETSVLSAALPVAEFRDHLRLGSGFSDDSLQDSVLESFLRAAMAAIESRTGKVLLERDFLWSASAWQMGDKQGLPVAPVSALLGLDLIDAEGTATAFGLSSLRLEQDLHRPLLSVYGACLPTIPNEGGLELRFTGGFGAWADVPADLQQAMLMLAAHYYEYRHDTALKAGCMPFGVTSLIERFRPVRIGLGARG